MNTCTLCGNPLTGDSPEGLCPTCLLNAAIAPESASAASAETQPAVASTNAASAGVVIDIADAGEVGRHLPQFEILEILGRGGMGVVYKARQIQLDRIVALKILPPADALSPGFVERFRREARSLAKLSHPNIVAIHDFGETNGLYYLVMEFIDGLNLRQMIRAGHLKPPEALSVVPKICDALQFAHEEGVVHRDIKPENILIDNRGRVKIADFGLAKLLGRAESDPRLTVSGATLGTPRYMAPEQADKPETVDHRADIYSLGVVFYEMLTGELPMGRFAPPSQKVQIDVRLDEIVLHAMERDVDRRYQHASEVRDDVERLTSQPAKARETSRTSAVAFALLVVCCVVGLLGCLWQCSAIQHTFTGGSHLSEVIFDHQPTGVDIEELREGSPMETAGLEAHDKLVDFVGQRATYDNVNRIWEKTPVNANIEMRLKRGGREMVQHAMRLADPVVRFHAIWQSVTGIGFLLLTLFLLLPQPFAGADQWRSRLAIGLGLGSLLLVLVFACVDPALRSLPQWMEGHELIDFGPKLTVGIAAFGLVLLSMMKMKIDGTLAPAAAAAVETIRADKELYSLLAVGLALYAVSFGMPAYYFGSHTPGDSINGTANSGIATFYQSLYYGNSIWFANPVLWTAWVLLWFGRHWIASAAGIAATIMAADALFWQDYHLLVGYSFWFVSIMLSAAVALCLGIRQRRRTRKWPFAGASVSISASVTPHPALPVAAQAKHHEPHFSRVAVWGAVGTPLASIGLLGMLFANLLTAKPNESQSHDHIPMALLLVILLFGCAIAITAFGSVAVWQIKRSEGRLYGLRFAAVEAILFPLIGLFHLVGLIVFWLPFGLLVLVLPHSVTFTENAPSALVVVPLILIAIAVALAIAFLAGRATWRAIVIQPAAGFEIPQRPEIDAPINCA